MYKLTKDSTSTKNIRLNLVVVMPVGLLPLEISNGPIFLNPLVEKLFFWGGHFLPMYALNVPFCGGFSPTLHTSTLAAILYTFVTQTTPTH